MLSFKIVLRGDSRKSRVETDDEQETLYRELEDADKEELGFLPLSKYSDRLENDLNESSMVQVMLKLFEQHNDISSCHEELSVLYGEICAQAGSDMEENDTKAFITILSSEKSIPTDLSEKDIDDLLNEIREWLGCKFDIVPERMGRNLPDYIEYGKNTAILGINYRAHILPFDKLHGIPETGLEEQIGVSLLSDKGALTRGYAKLVIGYLGLDEGGETSDGIEDNIGYETDDVLDALKDLISDSKEELVNEQKLVDSIENRLEQ